MDPKDRNAAETLEWARFKREVYQQVLGVVFASLEARSHHGETIHCGDGITRVLYPGFLIESLDGEEAAMFCCCRAALANFPCPKCLVPKDQLHHIDRKFKPRTTKSMQQVYQLATDAPSKTQKEFILQNYGLHYTKVSSSRDCC